MTRVLFVCTGNINRSAAAHIMAAAQGWPQVRSAGTNGTSGRPLAPKMRAALTAAGYDDPGHRSTALTPHLAEWADLAVAFQPSHAVALHQAGARRIIHAGDHVDPPMSRIPDPHYDSTGLTHHQVVALLERILPTLSEHAHNQQS